MACWRLLGGISPCWGCLWTSESIWEQPNTRVYIKGKGIVISEPSVVAVDGETRKVLAVGGEARRMIGKNSGFHISY